MKIGTFWRITHLKKKQIFSIGAWTQFENIVQPCRHVVPRYSVLNEGRTCLTKNSVLTDIWKLVCLLIVMDHEWSRSWNFLNKLIREFSLSIFRLEALFGHPVQEAFKSWSHEYIFRANILASTNFAAQSAPLSLFRNQIVKWLSRVGFWIMLFANASAPNIRPLLFGSQMVATAGSFLDAEALSVCSFIALMILLHREYRAESRKRISPTLEFCDILNQKIYTDLYLETNLLLVAYLINGDKIIWNL